MIIYRGYISWVFFIAEWLLSLDWILSQLNLEPINIL